jgi:anti-sigma factor RsiW
MCNHERLLEYLYDELPASERAGFEAHLRECGDCHAELSALGGTRLALSNWSPPDAELGFRIVRERSSPEPRSFRGFGSFSPAWAFAAAAILVLAVAAAISNIEVRYGNDGVIVRTGWNRTADVDPTGSSAAAVPVAFTPGEWEGRLKLLDDRLRQVELQNRRVQAAGVVDEAPTAARADQASDTQLLQTVRKIIAESEARQQRELAMRLTQVVRDFDATRAGDLARIEQGLRRVEGVTDAELIRHRETLNHLWRVTQQR